MKRVLYMILVLAMLVGLAIPGTAFASGASEKDAWTVMIYLCGTDLESWSGMATYNLEEIAETVPSEDVNVVIQTGGTLQWADNSLGLDVDVDKLQRYTYGSDGFSLVDEQPLANMGSPETLTRFISWAADNYPAEKNLLVMWDHGGGSNGGVIYDELHSSASISLYELDLALKMGGVHFETIALDCCLMAGLETALAVQPHADYLVASEETIAGQGTNYSAWLQYIYDNPGCDGAELGKVFCDSFKQKYDELGDSLSSAVLTLSAIDLSKITAVSEAFDAMAAEMCELLADPESIYNFSITTDMAEHYYDQTPGMVDLADAALKGRGNSISEETADRVIAAVDEAVIHHVKGDGRAYGKGISFYYKPDDSALMMDQYARVCRSAEYLAFLDAVSLDWTAPDWVYEEVERIPDLPSDTFVVAGDTWISEDGELRLQIERGLPAVKAVNYILNYYDEQLSSYLRLGYNFDIDGNFETGEFYGRFDGTWPSIDGVLLDMEIVDETMEYNLYDVPVRLWEDDEYCYDAMLRIAYIYDTPLYLEEGEEAAYNSGTNGDGADAPEEDELSGIFQIIGISITGMDSNTLDVSRGVLPYSDFEGVVCEALINGLPMGAFIISEDNEVERTYLPDGEYDYSFVVTDVFERKTEMDPISFIY